MEPIFNLGSMFPFKIPNWLCIGASSWSMEVTIRSARIASAASCSVANVPPTMSSCVCMHERRGLYEPKSAPRKGSCASPSSPSLLFQPLPSCPPRWANSSAVLQTPSLATEFSKRGKSMHSSTLRSSLESSFHVELDVARRAVARRERCRTWRAGDMQASNRVERMHLRCEYLL